MAQSTYYVVLPFFRTSEDELIADEPIAAPNAGTAKRQAERVARAKGGAVAFSRTGDPGTGVYEPAVILGRFGDVPEDLGEFTR